MVSKTELELEKEIQSLKSQLAEASFERDKYKKLFEASGDALSILDINTGKFTECNQAAVRLHGIESKSKFLTLTPADISPEYQPCGRASEELAMEHVSKSLTEGPQLFPWSHSNTQGETFPCLISLTAVQIQGKQLVVAIGRDISELHSAKEQLKKANTNIKRYKAAYQKEKMKFERFVNAAPIGIAVNSLKDGAFHYVNDEFSKMTGYSVDELNNIDYWKITPPKYQEEEQKQLINLKAQGRYGPYKKEYIHKSGHTFHVLLSGIKVTDDNNEDFIWSVIQDISRQKETEEQLKNARNQADSLALRMQLANNSAQIGVWEWDLVTSELIWDELMFKLYGISESQFTQVYDAWASAVHPDDIEFASAQLQAAIDGTGVYEPEFRVVHPNGEVRTIKASAEVIRSNGKAIKVVGVNYDVTEKIEAIRISETARLAAEHSSKAKSDFLANMSHEIRTPMNAILGGLQLLENANLEPDLGKVLANAVFSAKSLLTIINDILDYSKIESNKIELESTEISILDILDSVKYDLDALVSNKGIDFVISADDSFEDGWIGDLVRVKQIILNLASNAVKFTNKGEVKIIASCQSYNNEKAIYLSVQDSGIGMDEDAQKRIFERFSQADTSTTREYGGTGLGMSITVSLIKLMNGKINLFSEAGKGTTVNIILPLDKIKTQSKPVRTKSFTPPNLKHTRILIAEDNKINQILIKTMLKETNATAVVVDNGRLAIEALKEQAFDLVLMDIHMPFMDGVDAIKAIRNEGNPIPVIALTANVMVEDVKHYLEIGFDAHIAKPIELPILYGALASFVK
ncbi:MULTISPECIES: PAS domain S-box protein [Pseudoalteromonas]|uniref:PAS domain-containing hybrid sensor histidine kinase/response regulator n=1 Tax=Pseudoalteromonas TaxID=53246 RepID=UPI000FFEBE5B|nr:MULTISPECIES: PAS domain S-box protein [Pseudoalteromonas]NKC21445.1 PAS domain S-box protein [Pseudoalteromonas galatheae]RXE88828.1 PAS domain-containing sensor histidine kinase [Pseudoalteromonas sp. A757]